MQIAKWSESEQKPYDIREFGSLKAGNGVSLKDWPSYTARGYYEYQPVQLAEGEGLDGAYWGLDNGIIWQAGTVVSAQEMITRAQTTRHNQVVELATAYGADVAILGELITSIGLTFPCTEQDVKAAIKAMPKGLRPDGLMGDFMAAYKNCTDNMTDEDIAAVASLGGGV